MADAKHVKRTFVSNAFTILGLFNIFHWNAVLHSNMEHSLRINI